MTAEPAELSAVQLCRARNTLRQTAETLLAGSGLKIRELAHELVINNPRDPEKGEVHVAYSDGYVSWTRTVWAYWGNLQGYDDEETGTGVCIGADKILSTLVTPNMAGAD